MYTKNAINSLLASSCDEAKVGSLRIIWWNCGFSGLTKRRRLIKDEEVDKRKLAQKAKIDKKIEQAKKVIDQLIERTDILVLGEFDWIIEPRTIVEQYNFAHMESPDEYEILDLRSAQNDDKIKFNSIVIYKKNRFVAYRCADCWNVGTLRKPVNYKSYQMIAFKSIGDLEFKFAIAISHWRMRDGFGGDEECRLKCRAADRLAKKLLLGDEYPYKILLGDFNVEPYEEPMQWLCASRSKEYVKKYKCLYNPFWRLLDGEHFTIKQRFSNDFKDEGAIFDSILVNDRFVNECWSLTPSVINDVLNGCVFENGDHYPVSLIMSK